MDQQQLLMMMPGLQPAEMMMIRSITKDLSDEEIRHFYTMYASRRREPQQLLIMTLLGFIGVAGIQRFVIGETVMGILYFLTLGFCGVGTIIDLINNDKLAAGHNQRQAFETLQMMKMFHR